MGDFVALVSGGKDSLYSIMESIAHGYRLKAVVNLTPEIDSYMYQSVATENVSLIAQALDVPLYQFPIVGTAVCQRLHYARKDQDEVEDLFNALVTVKRELPTVEFISSGAILSDYQRIRVEYVASRLSLRSLAFLWRRNTDHLLRDMLFSSLDAIIVKIAAYGLEINKHLGTRLSDIQDDLYQLSKPPFLLNVCGEGGEYETFTLDCPLFRSRIRMLSKPEIVIHSEDGFSSTAYLRLQNLALEEKDSEPMRDSSGLLQHSTPFGRPFLTPLERLSNLPDSFLAELQEDLQHSLASARDVPSEQFHEFFVKSLQFHGSADIENGLAEAATEATKNAVRKFQHGLGQAGFTVDHVVYYLVCINQPWTVDVSNAIDKVFNSLFGMPWESDGSVERLFPPARTYIGVDLESATSNMMSSENTFTLQLLVLVHPGSPAPLCGGSDGLHVQSISHWAPASLGAYSQSIRLVCPTDEDSALPHTMTIFSGQIGLMPETLTLPNSADLGMGEIETQCWLALRHCHRLLKVMAPALWSNLHVAVCYASTMESLRVARTIFHSSICCNWSCCCDQSILWSVVSFLPHDAPIQWQLFARTRRANRSIEYISTQSKLPLLAEASWLVCVESCARWIESEQPSIFVKALLDRADCVAGVYL